MATIFQLYASPAGEHKETKRDSVLQRLLDAQPPHGQVSSQFILVVDFTSDQRGTGYLSTTQNFFDFQIHHIFENDYVYFTTAHNTNR